MRKLFVKGSEISATNDGILQEKEAIADSNLNSVTIRDDKTIEEEGEEYGKKMNKVIKDNMKLKSKIEDIEDEEENYDMYETREDEINYLKAYEKNTLEKEAKNDFEEMNFIKEFKDKQSKLNSEDIIRKSFLYDLKNIDDYKHKKNKSHLKEESLNQQSQNFLLKRKLKKVESNEDKAKQNNADKITLNLNTDFKSLINSEYKETNNKKKDTESQIKHAIIKNIEEDDNQNNTNLNILEYYNTSSEEE